MQTTMSSSKSVDNGLLFIRIGLGIMFLWHGYPKIMGGPEGWQELGESMKHFGIDFFPTVWGFMGAVGEFGGALLLIAGFKFRFACFMLASTMFVAAISHLAAGEGLFGASNAIEDAIVFIGLIFIGPGSMSVDNRVKK